MNWFFTFYYDELPADTGFRLYGFAHLLFLAVIALCVGAVCFAYRRARPEKQPLFRRTVACICLALELGMQIFLLLSLPIYPVTQLPLHLCGLGIFIMAADAFLPRHSQTVREILYSLSMPGAAAALLFPDWTVYPILNFFSLQCFMIHGILLCYPLMLLCCGQLRPDWRNLWRSVLFIALIAGPLHIFNRRFGTNFLYLNAAAPGSPLTLLASHPGARAYYIGYVVLVIAVWLGLYAPFIILHSILHSRQSVVRRRKA